MTATLHEASQEQLSQHHAWGWMAVGASLGTLVTLLLVMSFVCYLLYFKDGFLSELYARDRRRALPRLVILVRHGESQANVDKRIWQRLPDNLVALTERGQVQATAVGQRIATLLEQEEQKNDEIRRIHLIVSPFERALQTAACMRPALRHVIVRTDIESRIREQEMGNLQGDEFADFRRQQRRVGRFWYRFPTGESGSDVLDRVKTWWYESVLTVNTRCDFAHVDALVVVTHGLTMRFILMQLFGWSPTTFHSVWNAGNCAMYVLRRDLSKPGASPYVLDQAHGDMPRSSIDVVVQLKSNPQTKLALTLQDYLSVPPPRTTRIGLIGQMLARQYPDKITSPTDIDAILFMPFSEGGVIKGRSTSGLSMESDAAVAAAASGDVSSSWRVPATEQHEFNNAWLKNKDASDQDDEEEDKRNHIRYAKPEMSLRFPCIQLPEDGLQNVESDADRRRFRFFQNQPTNSPFYSDDDDDDIEIISNHAKNLANSAEEDEANATTTGEINHKHGIFPLPHLPLPWFGGDEEGSAKSKANSKKNA